MRYRLALDGVLTAQRGTYTLDLPLVQRDFQVEGGTITFTEAPISIRALDVSAIYNVRQYNSQDIKVRARLSGFLYPQPSLSLESAETFEISQSDLVSYLCCGAPNFELGVHQGRSGPGRGAGPAPRTAGECTLTRPASGIWVVRGRSIPGRRNG